MHPSLTDPRPRRSDRLPRVPEDQLTEEQKAAVAEFEKHRLSVPFGPFVALLRSPALLNRVRSLGDYLRYQTCFPPHLSEFAILVVASHWKQSYEWGLHCPIALEAGVPPAHLDALASGRHPVGMSEEEATIYDFCKALCAGDDIDDQKYSRMVALFGERGVVEAAGLAGYYTLLGMVLNTARTPPPSMGGKSSTIPLLT